MLTNIIWSDSFSGIDVIFESKEINLILSTGSGSIILIPSNNVNTAKHAQIEVIYFILVLR